MADLDRIVQVTISRATATPTQQSFSGILIAAEFLKAKTTTPFADTERVRSYADMDALVDDGWVAADFVYKAAAAVFSQNPSPNIVYVGRKKTGADGTETWGAALSAMLNENKDWYGFGISSRVLADQSAAADWAEANERFVALASAAVEIYDSSSTTDIAAYIKGKAYLKSTVWYDPLAGDSADDCIDFAILGKMFPYNPGSATYAFKTLAGVTAYSLTSTQMTNILAKNANIYTTIAGLNVTQFGKVGSGEWIDIVIGIDWLTSEIQTNIYTVIVNNAKIPFTDDGIQMIVNPLRKSLNSGVNNGLISNAADAINITYPAVADISAINKGNRILPDIKFTAVLAGAVHIVKIAGTLTY